MPKAPDRPLFAATPIEVLTSKTLSSGAIRLYGIIAYTSGYPYRTRPIWYSDGALGKLLNCSRATVQRYKSELERAGLIGRERVDHLCFTSLKNLTPASVDRLNPSVNNGAASILTEGLSQICDTGCRKSEGAYMKQKREDKTAAGATEKRGSITDSMKRAGDTTRRSQEKAAGRRFDRKTAALSAQARRDPANMTPTKFYEHFRFICDRNQVETAEALGMTKVAPRGKVKIMKQIIELYQELGVDKAGFFEIMEWLVINWEQGLKGEVSSKPLSIFTLQYHAKHIIDLFRGGVPEEESETPTEEEDDDWETRLDNFK